MHEQIDFTSSLYLGLYHPAGSLPSWKQLTTGRPAVLDEGTEVKLATAWAHACGRAKGAFAPSTLHALWDWSYTLSPPDLVCIEKNSYPLIQWAGRMAVMKGCQVLHFSLDNLKGLEQTLRQRGGSHRIHVLADGMYPKTSRVFPVARVVGMLADRRGRLILDDTQSLGLLGCKSAKDSTWGIGGGGTLRYAGLSAGTPGVVIISSLAKAFGVPLALIAGDKPFMDLLVNKGPTRIHNHPPSEVAISAAEQAFRLNMERGEALRAALLRNIRAFRRVAGLRPSTGLPMPWQYIVLPARQCTKMVSALQAVGIKALHLASNIPGTGRLTFIIRADHNPVQVLRAGSHVKRLLKNNLSYA